MLSILKSKYNLMPIQVKASFWFLICSFLQKGISVITTPIFTRLLTTSEYGQLNVFNSWLGIITIIVFLVGAGVSLFWGFLCFAIVQALDCLEGINYNLKKTSDNTQSIGEADQLEKDLSSGKRWKCPECGKIYMSYETSCMVCGISKPR